MPEIILDGPLQDREGERSQLDWSQPVPLKKPRENKSQEVRSGEH